VEVVVTPVKRVDLEVVEVHTLLVHLQVVQVTLLVHHQVRVILADKDFYLPELLEAAVEPDKLEKTVLLVMEEEMVVMVPHLQ
jgi:hypothetical protein